jgi:hypothetical protein
MIHTQLRSSVFKGWISGKIPDLPAFLLRWESLDRIIAQI